MFAVTSVAASKCSTLPCPGSLNTAQLAVATWRPCAFLAKNGTFTGRALHKRLLPLTARTKSARPRRIFPKPIAASASGGTSKHERLVPPAGKLSSACAGSSRDAVTSSSPEFAKISAFLTSYFPVWVAIACVAAVVHPPSFLWFKKDFVTAGLALTMLAMGTTLSLEVYTHRLLY